MRRIVAALAAVVALVAAPAALADTTWTKISRDGLANTYAPEIALDGSRIVVGWRFSDPANPSTGTDGLEVLSFVASETADALDRQGPANVTPTSQSTGEWSFAANPAGGVQVVFGALLQGDTNSYVYVSPRNPDGSFVAPARLSDFNTAWGDPTTSLTLADGTSLFVSSTAGGIVVGRGTTATPAVAVGSANLQTALGGCCGYEPQLGVTSGGQYWVFWYSNATGNVGIYAQQLDPATGQPIGTAQRAPQSESVGNSAPTIACAASCRLVYRLTNLQLGTPTNRIVTWAPGEAGPTTIASQPDTTGGLEAAAAYRSDGRLWLAWHENGAQLAGGKERYVATLGDASGAGGVLQDIGLPTGALGSFSLRGLALGNDLVLAANVANPVIDQLQSIYVNVIAPPPSVADVPETLDVREEGGKLKIRVQYRLKDTCASPCTARAEIRARTGKRLKAGAEPLPGDSTVLGTAKGIALTGSGKERFDIVVSKAKLKRAKGKVVGTNKFIETRLRVRLKQPDGSEIVTFRDGRIRVPLARLA